MKIYQSKIFRKKFILIGIFLITTVLNYSIEKYINLEFIKKESSPRFLAEGILITISDKQARYSYLRTNIDGWKQNYYFKQSLYGIFYIILPYNLKMSQIQYKLNIDGYWEIDPNNPDYTEDKYGTLISIINLPKECIYNQEMPIIDKIDNKKYKISFKYNNPSAKEVNFVTSIDRWCLYSHPMTLNEDGYWEISLSFKKGKYYYYFLVNGKKIPDIENPEKTYLPDLGEVSIVEVK